MFFIVILLAIALSAIEYDCLNRELRINMFQQSFLDSLEKRMKTLILLWSKPCFLCKIIEQINTFTPNLAAPGCSWLLLAAPGSSGSSWQHLGAPGSSWELLAAPDSSWQRSWQRSWQLRPLLGRSDLLILRPFNLLIF